MATPMFASPTLHQPRTLQEWVKFAEIQELKVDSNIRRSLHCFKTAKILLTDSLKAIERGNALRSKTLSQEAETILQRAWTYVDNVPGLDYLNRILTQAKIVPSVFTKEEIVLIEDLRTKIGIIRFSHLSGINLGVHSRREGLEKVLADINAVLSDERNIIKLDKKVKYYLDLARKARLTPF